jgi:hypothetical protein
MDLDEGHAGRGQARRRVPVNKALGEGQMKPARHAIRLRLHCTPAQEPK